MDSVTHIALGSAIGLAVMGRRTSLWKAAAWGGICETLPDLDVLIDHGDAIRNMTFHRAETHSLFYLSLASAPLAWLITRLDRDGASFGRWWLLTWLALITHPLLDWLTVYGTQLALPFTDHPFGVGSIFVIDPLYTLLLAVGIAAAVLAERHRSGSGRRWSVLGLAAATAYLGWGVAVQSHVRSVAAASLQEPAADAARLLVVPMPFNSLLWRIVAMEGDSYLEGYYSLLDRDRQVTFSRHPAGAELRLQASDDWFVSRIAWFSHGFFRLRREQGQLLISDLRMGQEPSYTFTFVLPEAHRDCGPTKSTATACPPDASGTPATANDDQRRPMQVPQRIEWTASLSWLWRRMLGEPLPFPGSRDAAV